LTLEVAIQPENAEATVVSKSNFKYMYWTMSQQLTHHTSNGCRVNSGDMMGSGTISGPTEDSFGSMRITWSGKINKNGDNTSVNLYDNDTVIMKGFLQNGHVHLVLRISSNYYLLCKKVKFI
jgi:fumarylacetoacetase